jgi:hypothetical protein
MKVKLEQGVGLCDPGSPSHGICPRILQTIHSESEIYWTIQLEPGVGPRMTVQLEPGVGPRITVQLLPGVGPRMTAQLDPGVGPFI